MIRLPEAFDATGRSEVELLFRRGEIDFEVRVFDGLHLFVLPRSQARRAAELLLHFWQYEEGRLSPLGGYTGACEACGADVVDEYDCPDCGIRLAVRFHRPDWRWGAWFQSCGLDVDFEPKREDPPGPGAPFMVRVVFWIGLAVFFFFVFESVLRMIFR